MIHHLYHVHACHSEVPEQTKSTSNRKGFDYLLTSDGVLGLGTGGRSSKGIDFRVTRVGSPATKEPLGSTTLDWLLIGYSLVESKI